MYEYVKEYMLEKNLNYASTKISKKFSFLQFFLFSLGGTHLQKKFISLPLD